MSARRKVSIVLAYYENAGMLAEQCENLAGLPEDLRAALSLVVVDDGSPTAPAEGRDIGMPFDIYRMRVDIRWNQDACRNLGAEKAPHPWLLCTDMDHLPPPATLKELVEGKFDETLVYRFRRVSMPDLSPYKPHPNSWFLTRSMYFRAGGYDERFAGWYGTDGDFRDRLQKAARGIHTTQLVLRRYPREVIPDASTTQYTRREKEDGENIRRIKHERAQDPHWKPKRLTFPWSKVYPPASPSA